MAKPLTRTELSDAEGQRAAARDAIYQYLRTTE
jgi:hypothetical protein